MPCIVRHYRASGGGFVSMTMLQPAVSCNLLTCPVIGTRVCKVLHIGAMVPCCVVLSLWQIWTMFGSARNQQQDHPLTAAK